MRSVLSGQGVFRLLLLASMLALTGCAAKDNGATNNDAATSGAGNNDPGVQRASSPTETPSPSPATEKSFVDVCDGNPAPGTARYGGTTHPLVVVSQGGDSATEAVWPAVAINKNFLGGKWKPADIQLVVCETRNSTDKQLSPCKYARLGKVKRTQTIVEVDVYQAQTGELLQRGQIAGPIEKCPELLVYWDNQSPSVGGDWITAGQLNAYANGVYKQKVKPTPKPTPTPQPTPTESYNIIP